MMKEELYKSVSIYTVACLKSELYPIKYPKVPDKDKTDFLEPSLCYISKFIIFHSDFKNIYTNTDLKNKKFDLSFTSESLFSLQ